MTICNTSGTIYDTNPIEVSLYEGDPTASGTLIKTVTYTLDDNVANANLTCSNVDDTLNNMICMTLSFNVSPTNYQLYSYVNDDGSTPASAPTTNFTECDATNNSNDMETCPSPMPVDFLSINALKNDDYNQLVWTVNESDIIGYYIQRSTDGIIFQEVGFVESAGNDNTVHSYLFNDYYDQSSYYRIRSIGIDPSDQNISPTVNVYHHLKELVRINPNPSTTLFNVIIESNDEMVSYELTNQLGQTIEQGTFTTFVSFEIGHFLISGAYTLRVVTSNDILIQRIIKQ